MYEPYVSVSEYEGIIDDGSIKRRLIQSSRHIDSLTFNRIVGRFDELTDFQREIIKEVCSSLTDWEYENEDFLKSVIDSYSINGVSVKYGGVNFDLINGVAVPPDLYNTLKQTGLCCRVLGAGI
ncbi:MAG: hypothetical protein IIU14_07945 [Ruminococcus sp.]|nr:hypothetical protein [Ruminococcus sp.]